MLPPESQPTVSRTVDPSSAQAGLQGSTPKLGRDHFCWKNEGVIPLPACWLPLFLSCFQIETIGVFFPYFIHGSFTGSVWRLILLFLRRSVEAFRITTSSGTNMLDHAFVCKLSQFALRRSPRQLRATLDQFF